MQITRKILALLFLTFFVGSMFVSLFHFSSMMTEMPMGMNNCPFASHDEVFCPMNFFDHIDAWKDTFLAVVPGIFVLIAAAGLLASFIGLAPNLLGQRHYFLPRFLRYVGERTYTFIYRFWQELFSNGILNPKLF